MAPAAAATATSPAALADCCAVLAEDCAAPAAATPWLAVGLRLAGRRFVGLNLLLLRYFNGEGVGIEHYGENAQVDFETIGDQGC